MIKATGTNKQGREVIILGLSEMNFTKLRQGMPIHIFGEELGPAQRDIVIFWGQTEDAMATELEKFGAKRVERPAKQ